MLQLLVVLVVTSDSAMVEVTPGLESVFFDKGVGVLLYLSLTLSFISLTNTRLSFATTCRRPSALFFLHE